MEFYLKHNICYASLGGAVPSGAVAVRHPSEPLVLTVRRDPIHSRGFWAISDLEQLSEPEGPAALLPCSGGETSELADFDRSHFELKLNQKEGRA